MIAPSPTSSGSSPAAAHAQPPRVQVLRAGVYQDMHGSPVAVTPQLMRALAESYDPALYAAPVVIGHPRHNRPRFGTVANPVASETVLEVGLEQLAPAFVEAHRAGHYPQRSLSFWPAGHPDNPLPAKDQPYIRHLGFLGAQPPAIKGLAGADLAEADPACPDPDLDSALAGVISLTSTATDFDPLEEQTMPEQSAAAQTAPNPPQQTPGQSAPSQTSEPADLAEREQRLSAQAAELANREAQLAAREQALQQQEAERQRAQVTAFAEDLADQARIRPADVPRITEILLALDEHASEPSLCFAEADAAGTLQQQSAGAWLRGHLASREPLVELGETATSQRAAAETRKGKSDSQIAREARAYRDRQLQQGITISLAEAVDAVEAGTAE